ncbi:hypothetical protein ACI8AG_00940 [Blastococcus sp. SYSU DS0552]
MTTRENAQGGPGAGRGRRAPDPLQMTAFEKRVCEWEARHDVAARGHRAAPDVVQHYLAHERLTEAARPWPAGAHAVGARQRPRPPAEQPPSRVGKLFRRPVDRG